LYFCKTPRSQKEITGKFDMTEGAISTILKRLLNKNFIEKIQRGVYVTTCKGLKHTESYFNSEIKLIFEIISDEHKNTTKMNSVQ